MSVFRESFSASKRLVFFLADDALIHVSAEAERAYVSKFRVEYEIPDYRLMRYGAAVAFYITATAVREGLIEIVRGEPAEEKFIPGQKYVWLANNATTGRKDLDSMAEFALECEAYWSRRFPPWRRRIPEDLARCVRRLELLARFGAAAATGRSFKAKLILSRQYRSFIIACVDEAATEVAERTEETQELVESGALYTLLSKWTYRIPGESILEYRAGGKTIRVQVQHQIQQPTPHITIGVDGEKIAVVYSVTKVSGWKARALKKAEKLRLEGYKHIILSVPYTVEESSRRELERLYTYVADNTTPSNPSKLKHVIKEVLEKSFRK